MFGTNSDVLLVILHLQIAYTRYYQLNALKMTTYIVGGSKGQHLQQQQIGGAFSAIRRLLAIK